MENKKMQLKGWKPRHPVDNFVILVEKVEEVEKV